MRRLVVMKSERLQGVEGTKRFSSATARMTTSGCSWSTDSFLSLTLTLAFMSQQVGIHFILPVKVL